MELRRRRRSANIFLLRLLVLGESTARHTGPVGAHQGLPSSLGSGHRGRAPHCSFPGRNSRSEISRPVGKMLNPRCGRECVQSHIGDMLPKVSPGEGTLSECGGTALWARVLDEVETRKQVDHQHFFLLLDRCRVSRSLTSC